MHRLALVLALSALAACGGTTDDGSKSKLASDLEKVTTRYVLADNAVDMWTAVVEYHALLQQVSPMMAGTDDASMGHQRQFRRTERNLDDFLIIPVDGGMATEGDDEYLESLREGDRIRIGRTYAPFDLVRRYLVTGAIDGGRNRQMVHNAIVTAMAQVGRWGTEGTVDGDQPAWAEARLAVTDLMERYHRRRA